MIEVDATEQLKTVAAQVISDPDQLAAFLAVADANRVADAEGNIDVEKVGAHLRTLFGVSEQPQHPRQWGQHSAAGGPAGQRGDDGRAELKKRFGVGADNSGPTADSRIPPGRSAREELAKRYGDRK